MKLKELEKYFSDAKSYKIGFEGKCNDCGKPVCVKADLDPKTWKLEISGGAIYQEDKKFFLKCDDCYKKDPTLHNFRECEVWSRVVGYLRPVSGWNEGKQEEFKMRKKFNIGKEGK